MPKRRSRTPFSWKAEYGGVPAWGIATAVGLLAVIVATPAVVNATTPAAAPYVRPSDAFAGPTPTADAGTAAFLGDSYTQGTGASTEDAKWVELVGTSQGWTVQNLGRGGTGYVSTSDANGCGLSYCPAIPEMVAAIEGDPAVVFVSGGQNDFDDWVANPAVVTGAIDTTFNDLRERFPDAQIIAVGPSTPFGNVEEAAAMSDAVQAAANAVGATFISLVDPPVLVAEMIAEDGAHANDLGHQAIADRVITALGGQ